MNSVSAQMSDTKLLINGQEIALKTYHADTTGIPVIALHGWLDNAGSFDLIAPLLKNIRLFVIDLPGHGLSAHRSAGAEYYIWSYVEDVIAVADALDLPQFFLLGHSMGGAISCLVSSVFPKRVQKLALLDSLGPMTTAVGQAPAQMRKALRQKQSLRTGFIRHYPTLEAAIEARARKGISFDSARILAIRGVQQDQTGYFWANDQSLSRVNLMSMTEEHLNAFLDEISCPICLIASAWAPAHKPERYQTLLAKLQTRSNFESLQLDGNHHQHLEGQVEAVAARLNKFFSV